MTDRVFGDIPGVPVGTLFATRAALNAAGVHRPTQAGISGSATEGADSIVLSGGYEDDEDLGDVIIYTGHGGQDPNTRRQIADQTLTRQNLALAISCQEGLPVRVVRGSEHDSRFSPNSGYRYDGLYQVESYWHEKGAAGFQICRFRLVRLSADPISTEPTLTVPAGTEPTLPVGNAKPGKMSATVTRVIRDTKLSREIKVLYGFKCQVCGLRLEGPAGPYAEAAHIRPLGRPHDGPDIATNLICLCPNHHFLFDVGAFSIADDLSFVGITGKLTTHPSHTLESAYLKYHREHFGFFSSGTSGASHESG